MTRQQAAQGFRQHVVSLSALLVSVLALVNGGWVGLERVHDAGSIPERMRRVEARTDSLSNELATQRAAAVQDRKVLYYTACRVDGQPVEACTSKYLTGMDRP